MSDPVTATPAAGAIAAPAPLSTTPTGSIVANAPPPLPGGIDAAMAKLAALRASETTPATGDTPPQPEIPAVISAPSEPAATPADPMAKRVQEFIDAQARLQGETRAEKAARTAAETRAKSAETELASLKARLKDKPNDVLAEHGWDSDKYIEASISGTTPEAVKRAQLADELKTVRDELTAFKAEQAAAVHARSVSDFKSSIVNDLRSAERAAEFSHSLAYMDTPEAFADLIYAEMDRTHRSSGGTQQLSAYDAATAIESTLRAKAKRLPGAAVVTPEPVKPVTQPAPTTTITNGLTATTSAPPAAYNPDEPDEARFQRAVAELKKTPKRTSV